jgi:transposase
VAVRDNPVLQVFYERLRAAGQVAQGAVPACRHKLLTLLNAMVQQQTPWQPQEEAIAASGAP